MAQCNFSSDWNLFFDKLDSYLNNRKNFEKEYNSICQKAYNLKYENQTDSACYYYMAAVLCYFYCDDSDNTKSNREWAVSSGKSAIRSALNMLQDDEEFKTLSFVFDLLKLEDFDESSINLRSLYQKIQSIKKRCPHIESIENTLIKNEALREWFDVAYNALLRTMLFCNSMDGDKDLKIDCASELKNSSDTYNRMTAYVSLADAYFDMGNYKESQRYAILGKDLLGTLSEYDDEDFLQNLWGFCWWIYAKCQEKFGEIEFSLSLHEKGSALGIPLCKKDMERLRAEIEVESKETIGNRGDKITKSEQEYLDMVKDCMEDGGIGSRERKLLDKIREKNGISYERAKELEATLCVPQLTSDEKEYLEAFKNACEDGVVSDKQRRLLEKLRMMYGISEERAKEIEKM